MLLTMPLEVLLIWTESGVVVEVKWLAIVGSKSPALG